MADITVIGLGKMGAAVAEAVRAAGHNLTVWNRTPAAARPFIERGAVAAEDVTAALRASPLTITCVSDYATTRALLEPDAVTAQLSGRTLVQLSTGTPQDARSLRAWLEPRGARCLAGGVLGGPATIGTDEARILLSGDAAAYQDVEDALVCLGSGVRFVGADAGVAVALDLTYLTMRLTQFPGLAHAAEICRAEGVSLDAFIDLMDYDTAAQRYLRIIRDQSYDDTPATLNIWRAVSHLASRQAAEAGINAEVPDFVDGLLERTVDAGYGEDNVMSLYKVLRDAAPGRQGGH